MNADPAETPDPVVDLVDELLQRLLEEPDPLVRWSAVRLLAQRLNLVRQVTARQLVAEGHTHPAVGQMLKITRVRVTQLVGGGDEPTSAQAWGRALGVAGVLAELGDHRGPAGRFTAEHADLLRAGLRSPAGRTHLGEASRRWALAARRHRRGELVDRLLGRLDELLAAAAELPDQMPVEQRGEIVVGYHGERTTLAGTVAWSPSWPRRAWPTAGDGSTPRR